MAPLDSRHADRAHAVLSASGAHRWIACPGSVAAESELPDEGRDSPFAAEGTAAHELAETCLRGESDAAGHIGAVFNGFEVDADMADAVQLYVDYVRAIPGHRFIEARVSFAEWAPGGFGTADAVIINGNALHIVDLKFGRGVAVDAEWNPQTMCYAAGALREFGFLYDIETVCIAIHQPRMDRVSEWELSAADLRGWAETMLRPAAQAALASDAPRSPGEEQCRWCRAKPVCRTLAEHCLSTAVEGFAAIGAEIAPRAIGPLDNAEIGLLLRDAPLIRDWLNALEARAHSEIERGGEVPGWKLVAGRSLRKWADEDKAASALARAKVRASERFVKKLISPAQAEKMLGKAHPVLTDHVVKPEGRPTLAPADDKRPALVCDPTADFTETAQS